MKEREIYPIVTHKKPLSEVETHPHQGFGQNERKGESFVMHEHMPNVDNKMTIENKMEEKKVENIQEEYTDDKLLWPPPDSKFKFIPVPEEAIRLGSYRQFENNQLISPPNSYITPYKTNVGGSDTPEKAPQEFDRISPPSDDHFAPTTMKNQFMNENLYSVLTSFMDQELPQEGTKDEIFYAMVAQLSKKLGRIFLNEPNISKKLIHTVWALWLKHKSFLKKAINHSGTLPSKILFHRDKVMFNCIRSLLHYTFSETIFCELLSLLMMTMQEKLLQILLQERSPFQPYRKEMIHRPSHPMEVHLIQRALRYVLHYKYVRYMPPNEEMPVAFTLAKSNANPNVLKASNTWKTVPVPSWASIIPIYFVTIPNEIEESQGGLKKDFTHTKVKI